jgi:replication factor A1
MEDDGKCPQMVINLRPLSDVDTLPVDSILDAMAVVIETERPMDVNLKKGGTKRRLNVTVFDDSGVSIRLTLWGEFADLPFREGTVALFKGLKVSDFNGKSLNTSFSAQVFLDADAQARHTRAAELAHWYREQGAAARQAAKALSAAGGQSGPPQTIREVQDEAQTLAIDGNVAPGDPNAPPTVKYATVLPATIAFVPHERQPFYYACCGEVPDERAGDGKTRTCNKKTERDADGIWRCAAGHSCPQSQPRWMSTFLIADQSGSMHVKAFDEISNQMIGCDATEAARLWDLKDQERDAYSQFEEIFKEASFKRWRLRLRCKKEVWNDEERLKVDIIGCDPVNFTTLGKTMAQEVFASVAPAAAVREAAPFGA